MNNNNGTSIYDCKGNILPKYLNDNKKLITNYNTISNNDWQSFLSSSIFINNNDKVLDIGCGKGYVTKLIEKFRNCHVTGIDVNNTLRISFDKYYLFDGDKLPFNDNEFDIVMLLYVFHHVDKNKKKQFLNEIIRVCKNKIIIHEDVPSNFIDKIFCWMHGKSFRRKANLNYEASFFSLDEYLNLFNEHNLKLMYYCNFPRFSRELLYPIKRMMFVLSKE